MSATLNRLPDGRIVVGIPTKAEVAKPKPEVEVTETAEEKPKKKSKK